MRSAFDRRVVPEVALQFVRESQRMAPCHLGGGAALSGAFLAHRLSRDLDLVSHDRDHVRTLATGLCELAASIGGRAEVARDAGSFVRARVHAGPLTLEVDFIHESTPDIEPPPPPLEGVTVESLVDLRANKITCILSRSEPRDLVDLLFLDRAGYPPEGDLSLALRKDAGIDPGVLAWLLRQFPVEPLPLMLEPLTVEELDRFRQVLMERFRREAIPGA
ncbi:MAG: nucleotidyl transferase AbiEii/AbiGii toxin family protein [Planctomycetes bacterium]|nr:nucleotidyl transferase AbiEii/AbiGii toxin family protein [Planctomycetota bacterium]